MGPVIYEKGFSLFSYYRYMSLTGGYHGPDDIGEMSSSAHVACSSTTDGENGDTPVRQSNLK